MATKEEKPPLQNPTVFINFRGVELRQSFIAHLEIALKNEGVNVFVQAEQSIRGVFLFKGIEESSIALVIFSKRYTESSWCLNELVEIEQRVKQRKLVAIPIFYKVDPSEVKNLEGEFGLNLWNHVKTTCELDKFKNWKEALESISQMSGLVYTEQRYGFYSLATFALGRVSLFLLHTFGSSEMEFVNDIVKRVKEIADSVHSQVKLPQEKFGKDDDLLGEVNSELVNNKIDTDSEENMQENVSKSSTVVTHDEHLPQHQVFINFRGAELRNGFVSHLFEALRREGVNVYIDEDETRGEELRTLYKRIEDSNIAIVIFSRRYTESRWCLDELLKIKELMDDGKIIVLPVFYKVEEGQVTDLKGEFGDNFWNLWRLNRDHHIIKWKEALKSVASMKGIYWNEHRPEREFMALTVKRVLDLEYILQREGDTPSPFPSPLPSPEKRKSAELPIGEGEMDETYPKIDRPFGIEHRMEKLENMLEFDCNDTRIIGVVGMPGIGKTTLAMMLHEKWKHKFIRCVPLMGIRKKSEDHGPVWLRKTLLEVLTEGKGREISDKTTHGTVKVELLKTKIFAVLDDVSEKEQLEFLLGDLDWIKKGSKIVITTRDKSLVEKYNTYAVPGLNDREALGLLKYHAFNEQICSPTGSFDRLSRMFVDYAQGHPLALCLLGRELYEKDKTDWKYMLETVTNKSRMMFEYVWRLSTDQLNEKQKDVLIDIICFFTSEDEYFIKSLLDSGDPSSTDAVSEVKDLTNKFLITMSDSRVHANYLLYMFGKELGSSRWLRLWNYEDIIDEQMTMEISDADNVRGIFLDMSKLRKDLCLESSTFITMRNLRYLKIYNSSCPGQCEGTFKVWITDELQFPLEEVRYFHWTKFPLKELPLDFRPENLVDLRLQYSKIECVWKGVKDTPRLKWVDLSYSSNLIDLSAMSKAENLKRLNLEGCSSLNELPVEIESMKSLVFMNLRGCIGLFSLPEMNLMSLKTLILSGCINLKEFQLISESLEVLHLDGTAIEGLPPTIKKLQRLVLLNLKNCEMLKSLPNCLRELKALEELILSGCSTLKNISDVRESLKHIQSLLIDRIGAKEMPDISCLTTTKGQAFVDMVKQPLGPREWLGVDGVSSLRRLCLSGNDFVSLQADIGKLYHLNWLDVKQCKMLTSIPMLPPKLQYFDAHGCDSLQRVANPLAIPALSEQIHATFNFSDCNKLDEDAKDSIISYTRWKSQSVLDAVSRYNGSSVLEHFTGTCFPGWEVPAWFSHKVSGSVLKPKLPPHWCDNRLTGIALCAVILLPDNYEQRNCLFIKCNCVFNNEYGPCIRFSCTIGSWSEPGKIGPSHVFIGYTSMLAIKKHNEEENEKECSHTEASFEFQVTDGTTVLEGCDCEVLEAGFSLVYAIDEMENICQYTKTVATPQIVEKILSEERSYGNSGNHDGTTLGRDEIFFCEEKSDATPNLQMSVEKKRDKDGPYWQHELRSARQSFNMKMRDVWKVSIDQLNERQKDVFLDLVYFFNSEDEYFVRSLLDPGNPEAVSEVRELADKFLITVSCGRVEMHDQLSTLGKDIGSPRWHRLWNYKEIIEKLTIMEQQEANDVRGIFLDMSEITASIALECMTFADMCNLLYLKIYDSCCPRQCKADCNLFFPDGLDFSLEKVRYLHWEKFPLEKLPPGFRPDNLVDLRLPYSKIQCIWEGVKDTPQLKWVDLRYSRRLLDLSALSEAVNLERLNLEGCTSLDELPVDIQNMKSLVFLNLRGCIRLRSLPKMNLISLETLILSDCSNLTAFKPISKSVKFLHLDGTAIKGLPPAIRNLQKLVVLNLKNCKMLDCLPDCLASLKFLDELVLSGCSRLKNLPDVKHSLKHLQILLYDGTGAEEMPNVSCFTGSDGPTFVQAFGSYFNLRESPRSDTGVSSLQRLCLSGNDLVSLQSEIVKLCNLKWLDVQHCKKLRFIPMLPPRLQYFDAHGCESLERVANPLARPVLSEQIHATFIFSDCNKLDQDAKDIIMSYIHWRSQLVLDELTRYNGGFALEALIGTCFPGWEVPAWFTHRASGSVLDTKLPLHWCVNRFTGIALCAVIVFHGYDDQRKRVLVKCNCELTNENGSSIHFSCTVGGWSEPSNAPRKIDSTHVFIGYTSKLDINKHGGEGCSHTEASFEFQVTDGTEVLQDCEVLKCGFSLLYATDELQAEPGVRGAPVEAKHYRALSKNDVATSNVRGYTKTAGRSPDNDGCEIVELPNKIIAPELATTPQPPVTEPPGSPEYGTKSNNLERERQFQASDVDALLSWEPQLHNASLIPVVSSSCQAESEQSHPQVFVSFQGAELRETFVRSLLSTLTDAGVNVLTGKHNTKIMKLPLLYKGIEESKIALVIFSKTYLESHSCFDELVMVDKFAKEGRLLVIPVFYDVRLTDVKYLEGDFGRLFKEMREKYKDEPETVLKWENSVKSIAKTNGIHFEIHRNDARLVEATVEAVQRGLTKISEGNPKGGNVAIVLLLFVTFLLFLARPFIGASYLQIVMWLGAFMVAIGCVEFVVNYQDRRTSNRLPPNQQNL